jgi:pimeloyl-ACP methyl ester carboxylesterase
MKRASLAQRMHGQGAPVVFVHGSNSDHRVWEPQRKAVARHFRYVACDQRYFGRGDWADDGCGFSVQRQIDDLIGLLETLDGGPAHLVGWSSSGDAILGVAMRQAQRVRSVLLHEPTLRGLDLPEPSGEQVRTDFRSMIAPALRAMADGDLASAVRCFMDGVNDQVGTFDALPPWLRRMAAENARTLPLQFAAAPPPRIRRADLRELDVPVTITCGEQTRACFRIVAEVASQNLRNGRLLVIPQARHLWPVQAPHAFNAALMKFFCS